MVKYPKTIKGIKDGLAAGDFTAVELVESIYAYIDAVDGKVKAFLTLTKEQALEAARQADEIGYGPDAPLLNGVPFAAKDNVMTKDILTTCASKMLEDFKPTYDATVVKKLRAAGAILIGKVNLDEFAMGGSTENSYFHPTYNPWDLERTPGGSSGGSSAAVSSRQVPFALGTDTGGSIRQPAAFTGIVGFKPTYGAVSRYGVAAFASSLEQLGPLTLTVEDAAIVMDAISGPDEYDMTTLQEEITNHGEKIGQSIEGMRIAVPKEFVSDVITDDIRKALQEAIESFEEQGAIVEEVSMPNVTYGINAYYIISSAEASSNLQRYDGIRYGYRHPDAKTNEEVYTMSRSEGFGEEVQRRIMLGTYALSSEHYDLFYEKAARLRTLIIQDFKRVYEDYDVILSPTTTSSAYKLGGRVEDPVEMYMADILTVPVNLAGLPAIAFPAGFDKLGLPIGLQLIGKPLDEKTLIQVAHNYEVNNDYVLHEPEL